MQSVLARLPIREELLFEVAGGTMCRGGGGNWNRGRRLAACEEEAEESQKCCFLDSKIHPAAFFTISIRVSRSGAISSLKRAAAMIGIHCST